MTRWSHPSLWLVLFSSATLAQSQKLNLPLPLNPAIGGGDVSRFELASDDSRVAYLAREASDARAELYSRTLDGSQAAVRLTGGIPSAETIYYEFQVSPDSKRIYFLTQETRETSEGVYQSFFRLYGGPLDGHSLPKRLAEPGLDGAILSLSPDGAWLVYQVVVLEGDLEGEYEYRTELYSVPTDGHREPIRLSSSSFSYGQSFRVANDRVVFVAAPVDGAGQELISITFEGTDRVVLGGSQLASRSVQEFAFSPDGTRVVYVADQRAGGFFELFSVPLGGGPAARLSGTLVQGGDVLDFDVSPDSRRVVYRAGQDTRWLPELFVAPIDGTSPAFKVSGTLAGNGVSGGARFSLDSARIVFRSNGLGVFQLFSAPADASLPPVPVSGPGVQETYYGSRPHLFLGAGNTVVYRAKGKPELFAAPLDGSAPPWNLSGDIVPSGQVLEFDLSTDGSLALFQADKEVDQRRDLFAVPVAGGAVQKINRLSQRIDLPFTTLVTSDGQQVLYAAVESTPGFLELYQRPADASTPPVAVNGPLSSGDAQGDVHFFQEDPGSGRVLYTGDQFVDNRDTLMSVRVDGPSGHVQLNDELQTGSNGISFPRLSHGRAVYVQPLGTDQALFSVPVDRASSPVNLTPALVRPHFFQNLVIDPDGKRVLFVVGSFLGGPHELYSAPVDGSAPPAKLSGTLVQYGNVEEALRLVPDGSRVIYLADAERDGGKELFSVAIDGGGPPVKLSGPLVEGGDVVPGHTTDAPLITQDGRLVVYRADALVDERFELFAAPPDGTSPPVRISGTLQPNGDVQAFFVLVLGDEQVVYRADALVDEQFELFLAPLEGGAAPARIDLGLAEKGDVLEFAASPGGTRLVLTADRDGDGLAELYAVALSGGRPRRLDAPAEQASVIEFRIDPAGRRVVYASDPVLGEGVGLFSAPLDTNGPPVRLDLALRKESDVEYFQIAPDGKKVCFLADEYLDEVYELFCAPIDGTHPAVRKNDPLPEGRYVQSFEISADSRRVFYRADQEQSGVVELFQAFLELPSRSSSRVR